MGPALWSEGLRPLLLPPPLSFIAAIPSKSWAHLTSVSQRTHTDPISSPGHPRALYPSMEPSGLIIINSHILQKNSIKKRKCQNSTQRLAGSLWTAGGREGPGEHPGPDHSLTLGSGHCLWRSQALGFFACLPLPHRRWFRQNEEESRVCSHSLPTREPSPLGWSLPNSFQMWNPKWLCPPGPEIYPPGCFYLPSTAFPSLDLIPSMHPPMEHGSDAPVARHQSGRFGDPPR